MGLRVCTELEDPRRRERVAEAGGACEVSLIDVGPRARAPLHAVLPCQEPHWLIRLLYIADVSHSETAQSSASDSETKWLQETAAVARWMEGRNVEEEEVEEKKTGGKALH